MEEQHQVTITRGFWIAETPITQEMWRLSTPDNPSWFKSSTRLPVEQISWFDCQAFIKKLNETGVAPAGFKFSLPTEAQWEYACRAGTDTPFWWGDALFGDMANCNGMRPYGTDEKGPYLAKTTEPGRYPVNPWGLYDTHGNVWEWCEDWFDDYPDGDAVDPIGPSEGRYRVLRGGSWFYYPMICRAAYRFRNEPDATSRQIGARLALVQCSRVL